MMAIVYVAQPDGFTVHDDSEDVPIRIFHVPDAIYNQLPAKVADELIQCIAAQAIKPGSLSQRLRRCGCMHMLPEDVEKLFKPTSVGSYIYTGGVTWVDQ